MALDTYDLVFEGGGAKGSVFVGALEVFSAAGLKTRRLIGTSAGAITATLLAAGYTPEQMLDAVNEKLPGTDTPRFSSFMDIPPRSDFNDEQIEQSATMQAFREAHVPDILHGEERLVGLLLRGPHYRQLFSFNECGGFFAGDAFLAWIREKLKAKDVAAGATLAEMFEQTQ